MRFGALVWPTLCVVLCLGVVSYLWVAERSSIAFSRHCCDAAVLALTEAAFLFFAGVGIASYSKPFFETTGAIAQLKADRRGRSVGLNGGNVTKVRDFKDVGFYPNVNIGYSIRIFGVHDPMVPLAYFTSWPIQKAAPFQFGVGLFVPDIDTSPSLERYGIGYVLTKPGVAVPSGMTTVAVIAGETLSRVPDSTTFSFLSGTGDGCSPSTSNGDGAWKVKTTGSSPGTLALRVTAEPGFKATIDGHPLSLSSLDDVMFRGSDSAGATHDHAHLPSGAIRTRHRRRDRWHFIAMLAASGVITLRRRRASIAQRAVVRC